MLAFFLLFENGVSNLDASIAKNVADARMMNPQDPGAFLKRMAEMARVQGREEAARNFEAALQSLIGSGPPGQSAPRSGRGVAIPSPRTR